MSCARTGAAAAEFLPEARDQRFELVELRIGRVVPAEAGRVPELLDHRPQRGVRVVGRAEVAEADARLLAESLPHRQRDAGLPDARLAEEQNHLALAVLGRLPTIQQQRQLLGAADERRGPRELAGLEPAFDRRLAAHAEGPHRARHPLQRRGLQLVELEPAPEEASRGLGDHHGARLRDLLQAGREVRRLAGDRLLLRGALADEVADHHEAGGDPGAASERPAAIRRLQPADGGVHGQRRPDCPLRLVLMRPRPAEIGEHAVAHELRDVPLEARDLARRRVLECLQHPVRLLGVEPGGERRRADEIGEHHGELPPLGAARPECLGRTHGRREPRRRLLLVLGQRGDRIEKALAVAEGGHAKLLQVVRGEPPQQGAVDGVLAEGGFVLLQAQAA